MLMRPRRFLILSLGIVGLYLVACLQDDAATRKKSEVHPGDCRCGALLLTRYTSLGELKDAVDIRYAEDRKSVMLRHACGSSAVTSILRTGITEKDFNRARDGGVWDKARILWLSPFALLHRRDLVRIEILGRRRPNMFGEGDAAFYDIAKAMVDHILPEDTFRLSSRDLSEKGYLNTFNHVMAQAFMTTLYGERVADFVADVHERNTLPALMTGQFTEAQLADLDDGPVDNYLDMINNEWGQALGKALGAEYKIDRKTIWTPGLTVHYLNAIQQYHSWVFGIGFAPFRPHDPLVVRFAAKINQVNANVDRLQRMY